MIDFAGCGAVHMVGGGGALIGAIACGYPQAFSFIISISIHLHLLLLSPSIYLAYS